MSRAHKQEKREPKEAPMSKIGVKKKKRKGKY
jgi:hypothetical protein